MGVFPFSNPPPASETASINMISTSIIDKRKSIAQSASLNPFEEVYNAIQSTDDPTINNQLLVASYFYHLPYWLDSPPISILSVTYTSCGWIHYGGYVTRGDALGIPSPSIIFPSPLPCGRRALRISGFIWCSHRPLVFDPHSWCWVWGKSMQYYQNYAHGDISEARYFKAYSNRP